MTSVAFRDVTAKCDRARHSEVRVSGKTGSFSVARDGSATE